MFGYSIDELKGHGLNAFIVPEELEAEGNDLNSLISSYQVIRIETVRRRKDKEMLSLIVYGVPVHMEDKTIGIFGVYVDITEQKKIEKGTEDQECGARQLRYIKSRTTFVPRFRRYSVW